MKDIQIIPGTIIQTPSGEVLDLGTWLGRKHAFAEMAGRCSAADAECLRQVRNKKMYRRLKMTWSEFCKQHLGMSRSTADLAIQRLEEFGPAYFVLAQATGITAGEYRRIQSAVHGQNLLHAGEQIPIQAENAPRLAAAVEALQKQAPPAAPAQLPAASSAVAVDLARALDKLERTLAAAVAQIERLHALPLTRAERERLLRTVVQQLHRIPLFQFTELRKVS